jgi:sialate O-acetylesterase
MIAPLIPVAMRGVLWYQGEANAICQAQEYRRLLNTLIADWRRLWQRELEFIIIQLPGVQRVHAYSEFSQWAILRNAQRQAAQESNALLAVTLKYGDVNDIHPPDKRQVGEICGVIAAEKIQAPVPAACEVQGNQMVVTFNGNCMADEVQTLMLAGGDGRVYPAIGRIVNGTQLQVFAPQVAAPVTLRYGWSDNPQDANLYGSNGLQVSPFEISSAK